MKLWKSPVLLALSLALASSIAVRADVKTEEKSLVKFEGMLGRVVGLFGGKAAREGVVSTAAVKGNRKMTLSEFGGQIIDLSEEKIYDLDTKNKSYKVTTFAELRRRLEEAARRARQDAGQPAKESTAKPGEGPELEVDFNLKESGQKKMLNGYDTREVVMTITVREKGKTLEQSGGMVLTANTWLGPKLPAMAEVAAFDRRYAEMLRGPLAMASAEQMAAAMAMYPGLKEALSKFQTESVNMEGTPIETVVKFEAVKSGQQQTAKEEAREEPPPSGGLAGALGGLRRRVAKKSDDTGQTDPNRTTVITMEHQLLKVSTDVAAADVALPAGYKENK